MSAHSSSRQFDSNNTCWKNVFVWVYVMLCCLSAERMSFSAAAWNVASPLTRLHITFFPYVPRKWARNTIRLNHSIFFSLFSFAISIRPFFLTLISLPKFAVFISSSFSLCALVWWAVTISWVEVKVCGSLTGCLPSILTEKDQEDGIREVVK